MEWAKQNQYHRSRDYTHTYTYTLQYTHTYTQITQACHSPVMQIWRYHQSELEMRKARGVTSSQIVWWNDESDSKRARFLSNPLHFDPYPIIVARQQPSRCLKYIQVQAAAKILKKLCITKIIGQFIFLIQMFQDVSKCNFKYYEVKYYEHFEVYIWSQMTAFVFLKAPELYFLGLPKLQRKICNRGDIYIKI